MPKRKTVQFPETKASVKKTGIPLPLLQRCQISGDLPRVATRVWGLGDLRKCRELWLDDIWYDVGLGFCSFLKLAVAAIWSKRQDLRLPWKSWPFADLSPWSNTFQSVWSFMPCTESMASSTPLRSPPSPPPPRGRRPQWQNSIAKRLFVGGFGWISKHHYRYSMRVYIQYSDTWWYMYFLCYIHMIHMML